MEITKKDMELIKEYGFCDDVPRIQRAKNISKALVRNIKSFGAECKLSDKEKWAAVLAGKVIDDLLNKLERKK